MRNESLSKEELIDQLLLLGIYKLKGRQLFELPLSLLKDVYEALLNQDQTGSKGGE